MCIKPSLCARQHFESFVYILYHLLFITVVHIRTKRIFTGEQAEADGIRQLATDIQ